MPTMAVTRQHFPPSDRRHWIYLQRGLDALVEVTPRRRRSANTAACIGRQPTIAASSMPAAASSTSQEPGRRTRRAGPPYRSRPELASTAAGLSATRKLLTRVRRPSSRITRAPPARDQRGDEEVLEDAAARPALAASMPTPEEQQQRQAEPAEMVLASTLMNSSRPVSRKSALIPVMRRRVSAGWKGFRRQNGAIAHGTPPQRSRPGGRSSAHAGGDRPSARAGVSAERRRVPAPPRAGHELASECAPDLLHHARCTSTVLTPRPARRRSACSACRR